MAIFSFDERVPKIGKNCYIAESAEVIGDVTIGDNCYIGPGAILRGDYGTIKIGNGTAVEENAVIHIEPNGLSLIGNQVTIGHGAIIHCNKIDDYAVIGLGAILCFEVEIGEWAIVAEGALVTRGQKIPPGKLVGGVPSKIIGDIKEKHKEFWVYGKQLYINLAKKYPASLKRIG